MAIGRQGGQHFMPVEMFGGEEFYRKTPERDFIKRKLCQEHGIDIIYYSNVHVDYPYEVVESIKELIQNINCRIAQNAVLIKCGELNMNFEQLYYENIKMDDIYEMCSEDEKDEFLYFCVSKIRSDEAVMPTQIPLELFYDIDVLQAEIDTGKAKVLFKAYDVLSKEFSVEIEFYRHPDSENLFIKEPYKTSTVSVESFDDFYQLVKGDIYSNSCFYEWNPSEELISKYGIDMFALNKSSLIDETYLTTSIYSCKELTKYKNREYLKQENLELSKRICATRTYGSFLELMDIVHEDEKELFISRYILKKKEKGIASVIQYLCNHNIKNRNGIFNHIFIRYGKDAILKETKESKLSKSEQKTLASMIKSVEKKMDGRKIEERRSGGFSVENNFFYITTEHGYDDRGKFCCISLFSEYFYDFESMAKALKNDLSDCDLCYWLSDMDFSGFKMNDNTVLPISFDREAIRKLSKEYIAEPSPFEDEDKPFKATVIFSKGKIKIKSEYRFRYIFDFLKFTNNDMSNMDLLFCDGLENITDLKSINFTKSKIRSAVLSKAGVPITNKIKREIPVLFKETIEEEIKYYPVLLEENHELCGYAAEHLESNILYITDIHLNHRIANAECKSRDDVMYIIKKTVNSLFEHCFENETILIGGDTTSDMRLFQIFVGEIAKKIEKKTYYRNVHPNVVITLGNHELWDNPDADLEKTISRYKGIAKSAGIYLLHNNLLVYRENYVKCGYMNLKTTVESRYFESYNINAMSEDEIRQATRGSRYVIFGGIGFSGKNESFNANSGIYRDTVNREEEIEQSKIFESLYNKVERALGEEEVIILTHMPKSCWHVNGEYHPGFVYVSGHTHRNEYFDDGSIRIYADNQIGYNCETVKTKTFVKEIMTDWFRHYGDGIHEISVDDYIAFHRGKNMFINYNRTPEKLYMLKKKGTYCFISRNKSGGLSIMNGGALNKLALKDIEYYYNNMEKQEIMIGEPYYRFREVQNRISETIRRIGGSGRIHGAIVDIDYYNHIYVNPLDMTITPYFAYDMVKKYVYSSVQSLLKSKAPLLYLMYQRELKNEGNPIVPFSGNNEIDETEKPLFYNSTDIYYASRKLNKMQKLQDSILAMWVQLDDELEAKSAKIKAPKPSKPVTPSVPRSEVRKQKAMQSIKELSDGKVELVGYYGAKNPSSFKCLVCGNQWSTRIDHFKRTCKCPKCNTKKSINNQKRGCLKT